MDSLESICEPNTDNYDGAPYHLRLRQSLPRCYPRPEAGRRKQTIVDGTHTEAAAYRSAVSKKSAAASTFPFVRCSAAMTSIRPREQIACSCAMSSCDTQTRAGKVSKELGTAVTVLS